MQTFQRAQIYVNYKRGKQQQQKKLSDSQISAV